MLKKILFFSILVFSINAFSQSQFPIYNLYADKSNPSGNYWELPEIQGQVLLPAFSGTNVLPFQNFEATDPNDLIPLYDSIYNWIWDPLILGWRVYDKTIELAYNSNNSIEGLIHCWVNTDNSWYYDKKKIYTYDEFNNQTSELIQLWHGTYHYFYDFERHSYTYDLQNNEVLALWQVSNTEGADWENTIQVINTYENTENQSTSLHQTWNGTGWVNDYIITKIYDADHKVSSIIQQRWIEGDWENAIRWDYSYDSNNNEVSCLYQFWKSGSWGNAVLYTSAYDENFNRTNYLYQYWISDFWEDKFQIISAYDDNNNLISEYGLKRDGNAWINSFRRTITYDENNFLKSRTNKNWDITGTVIQSADSTFNYFHTVTGIDRDKDQTAKVVIFPNPGEGIFEIAGGGIISVKVYDILGKQVYSVSNIKQLKSTRIDLSSYGKGIYLLKINYKEKSLIERIVIN